MCRFYVGTGTRNSLLGVHRIKQSGGHIGRMTDGIKYNSTYDLGLPVQEGRASIVSKFELIRELINKNPLLVHLLESSTNKSAALENARIRMQLFELNQEKEKMEMEKSEIAKRNKQLESLLAQQQGSPHLSGSLAPDKPLPDNEGGPSGAGQG